jgi:hypothetical protein
MNPIERPMLHWTEVPAPPADSNLHHDYKVFCRELPRLLAEGHAGKFVVIKDGSLLGPFVSRREALYAGVERFPQQHFLLQPVLEFLPVPATSSGEQSCPT